MKKKNGFTLIELLAVIIILGILMIIAIPSVTRYISDSRKNAYVDTAKEVIGSARNLVNAGKLEMYDTDATYYLDVKCVKTENAMKSPYGDFVDNGAYVVVTYDGKGYSYYWTSVDDAGQGVKDIVSYDKLDTDSIESDLTVNDIKTNRSLDGRKKVILITDRNNCQKEGAITENLEQVSSGTGDNSGSGTIPSSAVCRKATTLHQKTCERASEGCGATIGNGNTITYGTLVSGSPKAGDAFDCDVNNDGTYDSQTERFYYVTSDENKTILIYYTNINDQNYYYYDTSGENWHGPRTGYQYLPSTTTWSNPGIIEPGTRSIVAQNGATSTAGGTIESFTYTDKVARFLTNQELSSACGSDNMTSTGYLNNCTWLMENIGQYEGTSGIKGYWLETPYSTFSTSIRILMGMISCISFSNANNSEYGVRPVITVLTSNISN